MASKNLSLLHSFRSVLVGLNTVDGHLVEHLDATIDVILSRARMEQDVVSAYVPLNNCGLRHGLHHELWRQRT